MSRIRSIALRQIVEDVRLIFRLAGRKSILCAGIAALGSLLVAGVEASVAVFLQFFLKALGLLPEMTGGWTWLSKISLSPTQLACLLGCIGLVRGTSNVIVAQCIVISNESMVARIRLTIFRSLLLREDAELIEASRLNFIIADIVPKMGLFFSNLTQFITLSVLILGVGSAMLAASWQHSIIGVAGLFFVGLLVLNFNRVVLQTSRRLPIEQQNLLTGVQRIGRNWLLVKVLRTGKLEFDALKSAVNSYYAAVTRSSLWTYIGSESPPTFGIGILIVIVIIQLSNNFTPGGQFLAFLYLFLRFAQYVGLVAKVTGVTLSYLPSFRIGAEMCSNLIDPHARSPSQSKTASIPRQITTGRSNSVSVPEILFQGVSFGYPTSTSPVIHSFNLCIKSGEHLGIVGQSGAGKTTLLGLMLGLIKPTHGQVLINGMSPSQYFQTDGQVVGYVGPEAFLLKGTVRDNLSYGLAAPATDYDYWQALDRACLGDVIRKNAEGLDFLINENGDGLSAGQKQRLALARALLRNPKLLVLDEASANVDAATEMELALVIRELRGIATCVIVSHRPGFLVHVDRTILLNGQPTGAIAEA